MLNRLQDILFELGEHLSDLETWIKSNVPVELQDKCLQAIPFEQMQSFFEGPIPEILEEYDSASYDDLFAS